MQLCTRTPIDTLEVADEGGGAGSHPTGRGSGPDPHESDTAEGVGFICDCDRWHCGAVKTALSMGKPGISFNSGFQPLFDTD
jgi:hypothetical protein